MTDYRSTYIENKMLNPYKPSFVLKNIDIDGILKRNLAIKKNKKQKNQTR